MYEKKILKQAWAKGAVSIGRGVKTVRGVPTGDTALIFGVPQKIPPKYLPKAMAVDKKIDGYVTDVIETGIIRALNTDRMRPAMGGCSIGHYKISAGTYGCLVYRNGLPYILSNNHVLADSNNGVTGDYILQPGPHDGGGPGDEIATLQEFIPIHFIGEQSGCKFSQNTARSLNALWAGAGKKTRFSAVVPEADMNLVDAAIALPLDFNNVSREIIDIGIPRGVSNAELGMPIKKSGRTTGLTTGWVDQVDVVAQVSYGSSKIAVFEDQLMAGAMSQGGDSGSAVLDSDNRLVGLLFAGSNTVTIINRIEHVFSALNITL